MTGVGWAVTKRVFDARWESEVLDGWLEDKVLRTKGCSLRRGVGNAGSGIECGCRAGGREWIGSWICFSGCVEDLRGSWGRMRVRRFVFGREGYV